jgi:hypothetical protein
LDRSTRLAEAWFPGAAIDRCRGRAVRGNLRLGDGKVCRSLGATIPAPLMTISVVALSLIPELEITNCGLVDTIRIKLVPPEV